MSNAAHRGSTAWRVLKFGGTSVATLANWRSIAATVQQRSADGSPILIVHSALSGVTDLLERAFSAAIEQGASAELLGCRSGISPLPVTSGCPSSRRSTPSFRHCERALSRSPRAACRPRATERR